jgi:hypothetical protein
MREGTTKHKFRQKSRRKQVVIAFIPFRSRGYFFVRLTNLLDKKFEVVVVVVVVGGEDVDIKVVVVVVIGPLVTRSLRTA